jgi:hypothetical protein
MLLPLFLLCQVVSVQFLIEGLGAEAVDERTRCERALASWGECAFPQLLAAEKGADIEASGRARHLLERFYSRLPGATPWSAAKNLHELAIGVQRVCGKVILWAEDSGLRECPVTLESDRWVARNRELLWEVFESTLQAYEFNLCELDIKGLVYYKIQRAPQIIKMPRRTFRVVTRVRRRPGDSGFPLIDLTEVELAR